MPQRHTFHTFAKMVSQPWPVWTGSCMTAGGLRMQDLSTMTYSSRMAPHPLTSSSGAFCTRAKVLKALWLYTVKVGVHLCTALKAYCVANLFFKCCLHTLLTQLAWAVRALWLAATWWSTSGSLHLRPSPGSEFAGPDPSLAPSRISWKS